MASVRRLRFNRSALVLLLGFGGMAVPWLLREWGLERVHRPRLPTARKRPDQPDVYRDYLISGAYSDSRWRQLRRSVLAKSYTPVSRMKRSGACWPALMIRTHVFWIPGIQRNAD